MDLVTESLSPQVSKDHVGRLIGRGGCKINELRDLSGANIEIGEENADDDRETDVHLYGSKEARDRAADMINDFLGCGEGEIIF